MGPANCTRPPAPSWPRARGSSPRTRAAARSEALRHDRRRVDRGEPPRVPRPPLHDAGRRGVHQRRHPLRRDDPPEAADGTPFPELLASKGVIPGIKVDPGAKPLAAPRARRSRKAWTGCASGSRSTARSARASRSGARRTRSRTRCRATTASGRTRTRSPATRRSARRRASSRSSSPRCCRTARTRSSAAASSRRACSPRSTRSCSTSASTSRGRC